ncbi:hydroxyacid dehydrogenase [Brachybacterium endophyticum]|uniref:Hydroxyacid dehydrogenase n=1 Tax=Brachybacterium endophyticum TaxID=2182385 RepID=A0A2U2RP07_9MICO|nr:NAD(P)-dependent oxidoreductase [Brachybacterium endophyticum]PWH07525.1 hydroxyacid dehydrogenase [Brachybacterium endophyticum]
MKIAFLGTGRMGTELALQLIGAGHELTAWNRTRERTERVAEAGAEVAGSPGAAVDGAELIVTSLFGPDTVREVVTGPGLVPDGVTWVDTTTVSPAYADEFAAAVDSYVAAPVVGTLGPARNGSLGVYVGTHDAERRAQVAELVAPWADPDRLQQVDSARAAATGKLLANLALAVSAQGLREALALGDACGVTPEQTLDMLGSTGLAFIAGMKGPFVRGERSTDGGDFTVDAIAKDARLMLDTVGGDLPALHAALGSLEGQQHAGRGDHDFSAMLVPGEQDGQGEQDG